MKKLLVVLLLLLALFVSGCASAANVASQNLSTAADNFQVERRVVFINGITDKYLMVIEGKCSLGNNDQPGELTVTCKVGEEAYKKHFLGLSDNVFYIVEQIDAVATDTYHYQVIFRPEEILPDISIKTSGSNTP